MTYEPTVSGPDGAPIPGLLVTVNNEMTGQTVQRTTDGGGYANVAMPGWLPTDRVTLSILDPEYRFKGQVAGDAYTVEQINGKFPVALVPFV